MCKMKSKVLDVHIILFFDNILPRPDELMHPLNFKLNNIFDAMPNILPLPEDVPKEVPVVILKSRDNTYRCNISRANIDFSLSPRNLDDFSEIEMSFGETAEGLLRAIEEYNKIKIIRIGFVINYFIPDENPASKIVNTYIKKQMSKTNEISIRFNQIQKEKNITINNITYLASTELNIEGKKIKGIHIQKDINNQVNNKLTFDFLRNFIKLKSKDFSKEELDKVVV